MSRVDVLRDATLDASITAPPAGAGAGDVLLTGATGFLGGPLLMELLRSTDARVHCLVRGHGQEDAVARLDRALRPLASAAVLDEVRDRIAVVCGRLDQPRFGLSAITHGRLARSVGRVVHAAADVNYLRRYDALRPSNVEGTTNVIRFACTHRVKHVHHVSSVGVYFGEVLAGQLVSEDAMLDAAALPAADYARSKWVAEKLLVSARERGVPVTSYVVPLLGPHSETGRFNGKDLVAWMLRSSASLGFVPDAPLVLDMVPVDWAARAIAALASSSAGAGRHYLNAAERSTWLELVERCRVQGFAPAWTPYASWRKRLRSTPGSESALLAELLPEAIEASEMLAPLLADRYPRFPHGATAQALERLAVGPPVFEGAGLAAFVRALNAFAAPRANAS